MQHSSHSRKPRDVENTYLTGKFTLFYHKILLAGFHPHCNFLTAIQPWQHSYRRACWWLCYPRRGDVCLLARAAVSRHLGTACLASPAGAGGIRGGGAKAQDSSHSVGRYSGIQRGFHHHLLNAHEEAWCVFKWWQVPKYHTPFFPPWFSSPETWATSWCCHGTSWRALEEVGHWVWLQESWHWILLMKKFQPRHFA